MTVVKSLRSALTLPVLAFALAGCDSTGSSPDAGKSEAPPVTKESGAALAKDINAGAGALKGGPGAVGKSAPTPKAP